MKKQIWFVIVMVFVMTLMITGCQSEVVVDEEADPITEIEVEVETEEIPEPVLVVMTSFFPYYDVATHIGGSTVEVYQMVPDGADPHSFEPTPGDLIQLESSDLFIYNGVGFESWVEGALSMLSGSDALVLKAEDFVTLLQVTVEDDHDHGHDQDHDHDHEEEDEHQHGPYDPHIWTDPVNMKSIARHVADALIQLAPDNESEFEENYQAYGAAMDELDADLKNLSEEATHHDLLVSHSAFGYLAHRYGFKEIAVTGISPHTEPNPGRLAELTDLAGNLGLEYIFFETLVNPKTAEVLAEEAGLTPLMLYNVEGVTKEQQHSGASYVTLMEENIQTLRKALVK